MALSTVRRHHGHVERFTPPTRASALPTETRNDHDLLFGTRIYPARGRQPVRTARILGRPPPRFKEFSTAPLCPGCSFIPASSSPTIPTPFKTHNAQCQTGSLQVALSKTSGSQASFPASKLISAGRFRYSPRTYRNYLAPSASDGVNGMMRIPF